jgi:ATP-binding cassette subfamily F protein 2
MDRKTKHMSGGWRMRVSLAQALFAAPAVLLLDEPTNHLDLEACVWLEQHLAGYAKCLLVVSHSADFLNAVCTHTVRLHRQSLCYYGGNYDSFCATLADEERVQARAYEKQQADVEKLATFVRVNKANGVASSAKSKQKARATGGRARASPWARARARARVRACVRACARAHPCTHLRSPPSLPSRRVASRRAAPRSPGSGQGAGRLSRQAERA